jgi:hypothetical protein
MSREYINITDKICSRFYHDFSIEEKLEFHDTFIITREELDAWAVSNGFYEQRFSKLRSDDELRRRVLSSLERGGCEPYYCKIESREAFAVSYREGVYEVGRAAIIGGYDLAVYPKRILKMFENKMERFEKQLSSDVEGDRKVIEAIAFRKFMINFFMSQIPLLANDAKEMEEYFKKRRDNQFS